MRISKPSSLLQGRQAEASWIWENQDSLDEQIFLHFQKTFKLEAVPDTALAHVSASSFADLYINGHYVDRVPTNSDPEYQVYEEIEISPYLKPGENTITALVYNAGTALHHRMHSRGGFFLEARIPNSDGTLLKILSDKTWKTRPSRGWKKKSRFRQWDRTIGYQEIYDADQTAGNWKDAYELGRPPLAPWNHIVEISRERLYREKLSPVSIRDQNGYRIFDFGKAITASPAFTLTAAKAGIKVRIGTAERLNIWNFPVLKENINYTDFYLSKEGTQSWQPLTWRCFRYLVIQKKKGISLDQVWGAFQSFPVRKEGSFQCSDQVLNEIWTVGQWTMQLCAQDTWVDTPWREQTQYIAGDVRYCLHYASYSFAPNIKLLHDYNILCGAFSQRQRTDGSMRSRYPSGYKLGPGSSAYIPDYQLEWILMLQEHYLYFNDTDLIKRVYENLQQQLAYFKSYVLDKGLLGPVPGWLVLDHPPSFPLDRKGVNTAINCLYYGALRSAAQIARDVMEDPEQAGIWDADSVILKHAILHQLWSTRDMAYLDGLQSRKISVQTQIYALKYNLVPEGKKDRILTFVKSKGCSSEQSFSYWLLHSLFREGEGQWVLDFIRTNWGQQMKRKDFNNAWFEMWKPRRGMSRSHAWSSGPSALLPQLILGLEPILPAWKQFKIQPCLYDLKGAEAVVSSPFGSIKASIKIPDSEPSKGDLIMDLEIPGMTSSIVYIPIQPQSKPSIKVNQYSIWDMGKAVSCPLDIRFLSQSESCLCFEFQKGDYHIVRTVQSDHPADLQVPVHEPG